MTRYIQDQTGKMRGSIGDGITPPADRKVRVEMTEQQVEAVVSLAGVLEGLQPDRLDAAGIVEVTDSLRAGGDVDFSFTQVEPGLDVELVRLPQRDGETFDDWMGRIDDCLSVYYEGVVAERMSQGRPLGQVSGRVEVLDYGLNYAGDPHLAAVMVQESFPQARGVTRETFEDILQNRYDHVLDEDITDGALQRLALAHPECPPDVLELALDDALNRVTPDAFAYRELIMANPNKVDDRSATDALLSGDAFRVKAAVRHLTRMHGEPQNWPDRLQRAEAARLVADGELDGDAWTVLLSATED